MVASWSLAPLVTRHAAVRPEHVLAMDGERTWTYQEVEAAASALAVALVDLGIGDGDRMAVHLPSRIEWMITTLASASLGAVIVPLWTSSRACCMGRRQWEKSLSAAPV
jgi:acyl-coenzyme A synthetase/AMP-(fatty) acid ligase